MTGIDLTFGASIALYTGSKNCKNDLYFWIFPCILSGTEESEQRDLHH